jgi:hypothetical protein
MKKRILLSLVSFFVMTAMWASLVDAYQIYVTAAANGKTGATAELTLNMKNKTAIGTWSCTLVLPAGVSFEDVAVVPARYPEGYNPEITATPSNNNEVLISCHGEAGVALTGTDGAVATVTVKVASDVEPGNYAVLVKNAVMEEPNGNLKNDSEREYTWTIEQGEEPGITGDLNDDGTVDIADAVTVLNYMAAGEYDAKADINEDEVVDIADYVSILNIMAAQ